MSLQAEMHAVGELAPRSSRTAAQQAACDPATAYVPVYTGSFRAIGRPHDQAMEILKRGNQFFMRLGQNIIPVKKTVSNGRTRFQGGGIIVHETLTQDETGAPRIQHSLKEGCFRMELGQVEDADSPIHSTVGFSRGTECPQGTAEKPVTVSLYGRAELRKAK